MIRMSPDNLPKQETKQERERMLEKFLQWLDLPEDERPPEFVEVRRLLLE